MIIEYLALLSVKNNVYVAELYQALGTARENGKAKCEELCIEYRGKVKDQTIFLITKDNKIIAQFRVDEKFLYQTNLCFENWMDTPKIRRQMAKQNPTASFSTLIQNLRHGMKKVNVEAEVLEAQKPQLIHTQYGTNVMLTNALIADETGKVKLCLWGDQINSAGVGDFIKINNASVRTFRGERHLNLGRTGTLSVIRSNLARTEIQSPCLSKNPIYA
jgi:hypothetical protein